MPAQLPVGAPSFLHSQRMLLRRSNLASCKATIAQAPPSLRQSNPCRSQQHSLPAPSHTSLFFPTLIRSYATGTNNTPRDSPSKTERISPSANRRISAQQRPPTSASNEPIKAAEAREAALRAARLRRRLQQQDEVIEEAKKADAEAEAKEDYQRRYKQNARKYISSMIAIPIALVTSWHLFDRCKLVCWLWESMAANWSGSGVGE